MHDLEPPTEGTGDMPPEQFFFSFGSTEISANTFNTATRYDFNSYYGHKFPA